MEEDYVADSADDNWMVANYYSSSNKTQSDNISSPPILAKETAAPSAPAYPSNASDASPEKDIMETNDTGSSLIATPTITILRHDFQAAAAPNASPEFVKNIPLIEQ
ncbi:unnamed protein product [Rhizophagus irregularis]|nr:unnamed protein product [Rhizophagus irregularis]